MSRPASVFSANRGQLASRRELCPCAKCVALHPERAATRAARFADLRASLELFVADDPVPPEVRRQRDRDSKRRIARLRNLAIANARRAELRAAGDPR